MTLPVSRRAFALASLMVIGGACVSPLTAAEKPLPAAEQPLKPEHNPPGDIPDNQVFIEYASPLGFGIKVPEGWAREDRADGAIFSDKYGRIALSAAPTPSAPDIASVRAKFIPELEQTARAVKITAVKEVVLPAGKAILVSYGSNSDPNPVTSKAIRLESDRYYFWKGGQLIILDMSAPAGADNVDQWDLMSKSFRWR